MAKLNDNKKLGVIAGVSVALCGIAGGGVYWAKGLVQEKKDAIAGMRDEIKGAEDKIRKINDVERDVIILRENLLEYVKILPDEKELTSFTRVTNRFVGQSGVVMTNFQPVGGGGKRNGFELYTYKFEIRATLWQFMQFVSFFEEYERFIQVKDFNLSAGKAVAGGGDVEHQIQMTVETYVYTGSTAGSGIKIQKYPQKVARLQEEIFEARQAIASVGYKFEGPRGRRDIFIDPRETSAGQITGRTGPSPADQRDLIQRISARIKEAQKIYDRLQDRNLTIFEKYTLDKKLRDQITALQRDVDEASDRNYISHTPLKLVWRRDVIEPLDLLRRGASVIAGGEEDDRWLADREMKAMLEKMKEDLRMGAIQEAIARRETLGDRIDVPRSDPRYPLRVSIETLYERAKVAQEFSGLPLDISGVCVNEGGRSGLILNGTVYEEGEYIDNQLLVKNVGRDRVEFVYKGFTIVRTQ